MRVAVIFVLGLLAGAILVAGSQSEPSKVAAPAKPNVTSLLQTALDEKFTPGRDVIVDLVEIPPGGTIERHWHPGEEFQYYLEGEAQVEVEGQPTTVGKTGTVGHIPFKKLHRATAGPKGAKVIVFRVHTHGEPWRHAEGEGDHPSSK